MKKAGAPLAAAGSLEERSETHRLERRCDDTLASG